MPSNKGENTRIPGESSIRRILFASRACYLDDSNGAAVASRAMMEALARLGFAVEVVTGTATELHPGVQPADWLAERGIAFQISDGSSWSVDARGVRSNVPLHLRLAVRDVLVTLHRSAAAQSFVADDAEREEFFALYEAVLERFRPDVVVNYGGISWRTDCGSPPARGASPSSSPCTI